MKQVYSGKFHIRIINLLARCATRATLEISWIIEEKSRIFFTSSALTVAWQREAATTGLELFDCISQ